MSTLWKSTPLAIGAICVTIVLLIESLSTVQSSDSKQVILDIERTLEAELEDALDIGTRLVQVNLEACVLNVQYTNLNNCGSPLFPAKTILGIPLLEVDRFSYASRLEDRDSFRFRFNKNTTVLMSDNQPVRNRSSAFYDIRVQCDGSRVHEPAIANQKTLFLKKHYADDVGPKLELLIKECKRTGELLY